MKSAPVLLVPAYNESHRFSAEYFLNLQKLCSNLKIIFINDGSTDTTLSVLHATTRIVPDSLVINLEKNVGKANAIREGFLLALEIFPESIWVGFVDADGSFLIEEIANTIAMIEDAADDFDAVFTKRKVSFEQGSNQKILRIAASNLVFKFLVLGWGQHPDDIQSGFKFFRISEALTFVLASKFKTGWFFEWEIIIRLRSRKVLLRTLQVPVKFSHQENSHIDFRRYPRILSEVLFIKLQQIKSIVLN